MAKMPWLTERQPRSRQHKWEQAPGLFGSGFVVCQKCGMEVRASQAKRGAGVCPGKRVGH